VSSGNKQNWHQDEQLLLCTHCLITHIISLIHSTSCHSSHTPTPSLTTMALRLPSASGSYLPGPTAVTTPAQGVTQQGTPLCLLLLYRKI
jgi:hypothetical protein